MQNGKYRKDYSLMCESVDRNDRLRPNSFMSMAQEVSDEDAERLGFGFRQLQPLGKAWIIARMHFCVFSPAIWKEKVSIETWHRGTQGPFYVRDYVLFGEDGSIKVTGVSSWIIMDINERKMERIHEVANIISPEACCEESTGNLCPKIVFPRNCERKICSNRIVSYSDIDHNGHTNNTMYISWALDCLPRSVTLNNWCREVFINFSRETMPEDVVELYYAEPNPGEFIVEGTCNGNVAFTAKLIYDQEAV